MYEEGQNKEIVEEVRVKSLKERSREGGFSWKVKNEFFKCIIWNYWRKSRNVLLKGGKKQ